MARQGKLELVVRNVPWCLQVTPGSELAQPSSQMDLMPTLVELARGKLPKNLLLDGVSMAGGGSRQGGLVAREGSLRFFDEINMFLSVSP